MVSWGKCCLIIYINTETWHKDDFFIKIISLLSEDNTDAFVWAGQDGDLFAEVWAHKGETIPI